MNLSNISDYAANAVLGQENQLNSHGWVRVETGSTDEAHLRQVLITVATALAALGTPTKGRGSRQVIEQLIPREVETAHPSSLSKKYGLGEFPFHIDTAHWPIPCRYILLACVNPGLSDTPTHLLNRERVTLSKSELQLARTGIFYVRNGRNSFYSCILEGNRSFLRLDPGCMEPESSEAMQALTLFSSIRVSHLAEHVSWRAGTIIVIDNWRVLHARGLVNATNEGRTLLRCITI